MLTNKLKTSKLLNYVATNILGLISLNKDLQNYEYFKFWVFTLQTVVQDDIDFIFFIT